MWVKRNMSRFETAGTEEGEGGDEWGWTGRGGGGEGVSRVVDGEKVRKVVGKVEKKWGKRE